PNKAPLPKPTSRIRIDFRRSDVSLVFSSNPLSKSSPRSPYTKLGSPSFPDSHKSHCCENSLGWSLSTQAFQPSASQTISNSQPEQAIELWPWGLEIRTSPSDKPHEGHRIVKLSALGSVIRFACRIRRSSGAVQVSNHLI